MTAARGRLALAGALALLLVLPTTYVAAPAMAATCAGAAVSWDGGGGDSSWTNAANWSPDVVPGPQDVVRIATSATLPAVTVSGMTGSVCELRLEPGSSTVTLSGALTVSGKLWYARGTVRALSTGGATLTVTGEAALGLPGLAESGSTRTLDGVALHLADGPLDLVGQTLHLTGTAALQLGSGATVTSSKSGGLIVAKTGSTVQVLGSAGVLAPATVQLESGSAITAATNPATLGGTGILHWQGGTLAGNLTTSLQTVMDGTGTRVVAAGGTWTNGARADVVAGTVQVDGALVNTSTLRLHPDAVLTRTAGSGGSLANTGILAAGASDTAAGSGTVSLSDLPLNNTGTVQVTSGLRLHLSGNPAAPVTSSWGADSILRDPLGTATPGVLSIGAGAGVQLAGSTSLEQGLILRLDDESSGVGAGLVGAAGSDATLTGAGSFDWRSGTVSGALRLAVSTAATSTAPTSARVLDGALTLAGPTAISGTTVALRPGATVAVAGTTTLAGDPAGVSLSGAVAGQSLTVLPGGTLRRAAPASADTAVGPATIDVPVTNSGSLSVEAPLDLRAGFSQARPTGSDPATTDEPVTSLLGGTARLRSVDPTGTYGPLTFAEGGLGGIGTLSARTVGFGTGWLHPGLQATAGRLVVEGDLTLAEGSDVQIVMRGTTATTAPAGKDELHVVPLVVGGTTVAAGRATLSGKITGISTGEYAPPYGTVVADVMRFTARTGAFDNASSFGTPTGLGWRPRYDTDTADGDGLGVDLRLSDVAPPALGLARVPAFTQATWQRFTYAGVDNRAGVKNYDVRWRVATPTSAFGKWKRPAKWQKTHQTWQQLNRMKRGRTYCVSLRARDKAGNISTWSKPLCTARMHDDRQLIAKGSWARVKNRPGFYGGTFSRSRAKGSKLVKAGTFTRIAVTGVTCPSCGKVKIKVGKQVVKKVNLRARKTRTKTWVSKVRVRERAKVRVVVMTRGKPVVIDSFGLMR